MHPWRNIAELPETTSGIHFSAIKIRHQSGLNCQVQLKVEAWRALVWGRARGICTFWEPSMSAAFRFPEVMHCLPVFLLLLANNKGVS